MIVTELEQVDNKRQRVHLDNGSFFVAYKKEIKNLDIEPEEELSEEKYQEFLKEVLIPRGKKRAMHLLEKMDRTEFQLRQKLEQSYYPPEVIDEAVSYVKGYHYIDDYRYACSYIRFRCQSKSQRQLTMELYQKGISKELVAQAMETEYPFEDESAKIMRWIEKKHYDMDNSDAKQKQKIYQFLLRKGFRSSDILSLLK